MQRHRLTIGRSSNTQYTNILYTENIPWATSYPRITNKEYPLSQISVGVCWSSLWSALLFFSSLFLSAQPGAFPLSLPSFLEKCLSQPNITAKSTWGGHMRISSQPLTSPLPGRGGPSWLPPPLSLFNLPIITLLSSHPNTCSQPLSFQTHEIRFGSSGLS